MRAWLNEAEPSINALFIAGDNIVTAATPPEIANACHAAAGVIARAQHDLTSPDVALNSVLRQAITDYQAGIRDCISATRRGDTVDTGYVNQAITDLQNAVEVLEGDLSRDARQPEKLTV
ncbi:hypothetical protein GCM10009641_08530 [Mycobacterium cookii]|uniref:Uncharacterized protein n=1 Tax=Mycobacterium cookii TaxID=1775 RepID=A0A7I7L1W9_9MYCO|nr:hypothetical protein [Mycobacterium cookii]MCV7333183.1 hypothetical protein [Mycobacterium cookii]BBX48103.1 hypothetical protein MCOO_41180 [Mycobacterium cookii]